MAATVHDRTENTFPFHDQGACSLQSMELMCTKAQSVRPVKINRSFAYRLGCIHMEVHFWIILQYFRNFRHRLDCSCYVIYSHDGDKYDIVIKLAPQIVKVNSSILFGTDEFDVETFIFHLLDDIDDTRVFDFTDKNRSADLFLILQYPLYGDIVAFCRLGGKHTTLSSQSKQFQHLLPRGLKQLPRPAAFRMDTCGIEIVASVHLFKCFQGFLKRPCCRRVVHIYQNATPYVKVTWDINIPSRLWLFIIKFFFDSCRRPRFNLFEPVFRYLERTFIT